MENRISATLDIISKIASDQEDAWDAPVGNLERHHHNVLLLFSKIGQQKPSTVCPWKTTIVAKMIFSASKEDRSSGLNSVKSKNTRSDSHKKNDDGGIRTHAN